MDFKEKKGRQVKRRRCKYIYSITDYIHHVFCFEKLYGTEYTSNVLFNRIITANHLDKNHIVKFDEEILIPFNYSLITFIENLLWLTVEKETESQFFLYIADKQQIIGFRGSTPLYKYVITSSGEIVDFYVYDKK